ncbi:putative C6 transcription factor [Aspergillus clavatus NRRL 1]|uniref:C6 transcription factor, putative n=1 Tax=Aspergillus clavatus (strain ATCC 1007 / CBS 513.65 / DSM 816 / NCTC 3887 / NRRL 1 / QM 1276 / 107) TaxID=344612 RepID=A1CGA9_ASPCL|nr:C6 transcription factor, putative [Aspergillus clavatus NRRL 1]EAW10989.1 C6 transcription factor, putative [Aspergillus clavatus NRRL 1]
MFHTFEGFENPGASAQTKPRGERQPSVSRRVTTLRACTSCRHRKIKCDGEKPCEACRWYKKADQCHYSDPRPSRRHVEKLSTTLDEYRSILERLFPSTSPEVLVSLSREKLLELSGKGPSQQQAHHPASPATSSSVEAHVSPISEEDGNLESLQTMPEESNDSRNRSSDDITNAISDDVNALSLSARQPSSYLGVSSIHAVPKVIVWLDPGSLSYFSRTPPVAPRRDSVRDYPAGSEDQNWHIQSSQQHPITPPQTQMQVTEVQLLDAYFTWFQPFVPMLDEQVFRETYLSGCRRDDRWLGLLNIVFALGSIAACSSDDMSHALYYQRAKSYLNLDSLGSSHLETIQTLGLAGGYYLHYTSQPNLAYSLMGAALRMAAALGLHKEFSDSPDGSNKEKILAMDMKRRTWWSLFCMDTWGGMTLGRPSMGRLGPTITVKLPNHRESGNVLDILPLLENVRFCKIATQIQEVLAVAPLTKHAEMAHLDSLLLEWYGNLPSILKDHEPCSESIMNTRTVMRWRYYNQRMLLYRPTLLSYAMRRVPNIALRSEERTAIERCREIAEATIQDISSTVRSHQMSGWNAVWLVFQATMVPLLGLFLNDPTASDPRASFQSCQSQVETAMLLLARLQPWSRTAKRTLEAVSRILEASKRGSDMGGAPNGVSGGNLPDRESLVSGMMPGNALAQTDSGRSVGIANDGSMMDPMAAFMDDSAGQQLWDFLSWSDSTIWPGFAEADNANEMSFAQDEKNAKYGSNAPGFFGSPMTDSTYYMNSSVPFYSHAQP